MFKFHCFPLVSQSFLLKRNMRTGKPPSTEGNCKQRMLQALFEDTRQSATYTVKAVVFPGVRHGYDSWIMKKAEHQKTDTFRLQCWRRLLRGSQTARRSNKPILKEVNPEYSWEELILKLKLQYSGHLRRSANSLEKTLMLGKIEGRKRKGRQRMRWLGGITDSMDMSQSRTNSRTQ